MVQKHLIVPVLMACFIDAGCGALFGRADNFPRYPSDFEPPSNAAPIDFLFSCLPRSIIKIIIHQHLSAMCCHHRNRGSPMTD